MKPSAVYNVLKCHNLNTRKQRLEYMRIKNGVVATHSDLERDRDKSKNRSLSTKYPGHISEVSSASDKEYRAKNLHYCE